MPHLVTVTDPHANDPHQSLALWTVRLPTSPVGETTDRLLLEVHVACGVTSHPYEFRAAGVTDVRVGRNRPSLCGPSSLGEVARGRGLFVNRRSAQTERASALLCERKEIFMAVVTMRQLMESGVHFGHQTRRWNPKMKRFIMTERNGIYIVDLNQSLSYLDQAYEFVRDTVAHGGTILFVGTKKQAQEAIAEQAARVGMPYVNERWLGGMLTNFSTVHERLKRLKELEEMDLVNVANSGGRTKKELLMMRREKEKLTRTLGGIRDMGKVPSAVWIVDTNKEALAVNEARKLHIPVVAILDTNCDPDVVDYPIPGNDDAIRAVGLLTRVVADAVAEGLIARAGANESDADTDAGAAAEPMPEWERELLGADDAAAQESGEATETPAEAPAAEAEAPAAEATADAASDTAEPAAEKPADETTEEN